MQWVERKQVLRTLQRIKREHNQYRIWRLDHSTSIPPCRVSRHLAQCQNDVRDRQCKERPLKGRREPEDKSSQDRRGENKDEEDCTNEHRYARDEKRCHCPVPENSRDTRTCAAPDRTPLRFTSELGFFRRSLFGYLQRLFTQIMKRGIVTLLREATTLVYHSIQYLSRCEYTTILYKCSLLMDVPEA